MPADNGSKRAAALLKQYGTKADVARQMLDEGYSVTEISNAVPMSYSQVHSINNKRPVGSITNVVKRQPPVPGQIEKVVKQPAPAKKGISVPTFIEPASPSWGELPPIPRKGTKPKGQVKANPKIGKLRTPGLPSDIAVGDCANCGYDLVVRSLPTGFTLVHTNISAEEFLATIQFCQAVPRALWE